MPRGQRGSGEGRRVLRLVRGPATWGVGALGLALTPTLAGRLGKSCCLVGSPGGSVQIQPPETFGEWRFKQRRSGDCSKGQVGSGARPQHPHGTPRAGSGPQCREMGKSGRRGGSISEAVSMPGRKCFPNGCILSPLKLNRSSPRATDGHRPAWRAF